MNLEAQIIELEFQKSIEIASLKQHTVRATRDVKRALSPDRFVRKHINAALIAAAAAGMVIAPAPKYVKKSEIREEVRKARRRGSGLMGMLSKFVPGLENFIPQQQQAAAPEPESSHQPGLFGVLVGQVLTMIMGRVDWHSLLQQVISKGQQAAGADPQYASNNGHSDEPHFSVGDAGTGRPPE